MSSDTTGAPSSAAASNVDGSVAGIIEFGASFPDDSPLFGLPEDQAAAVRRAFHEHLVNDLFQGDVPPAQDQNLLPAPMPEVASWYPCRLVVGPTGDLSRQKALDILEAYLELEHPGRFALSSESPRNPVVYVVVDGEPRCLRAFKIERPGQGPERFAVTTPGNQIVEGGFFAALGWPA